MSDSVEARIRAFSSTVPHNAALGIDVRGVGEGRAAYALPYKSEFAGSARTGVLHGGAITALMDAACGAAVFSALRTPQSIATIELRIDYLRPARPGEEVVAEAECLRVTHHVAFARSTAFHPVDREPIALATGTFMVNTAITRAPESERRS